MSEIPSMSWYFDDNIPWNVFKVHVNVSIDTKLYICKIRTYNIKHFSGMCHIARARRASLVPIYEIGAPVSVLRSLRSLFSLPMYPLIRTLSLKFILICLVGLKEYRLGTQSLGLDWPLSEVGTGLDQ